MELPSTFAPTYELIYGSPGRSLALEIASRLGLSSSVIEAARNNLSAREVQLAEHLALRSELGNLSDKSLDAAERRLADWRFIPNGSEGFAKAEVTIGGISTADLSSQTMESKRVPSLFAIGEAVDVTGWLGGYNFQWAWASAHAAAQAL